MIAPLVCVIPVFDAERTLGAVIAGVRSTLPSAHVLVVNDGSSDGSGRVADAAADRVLHFKQNRGKGAALQAAFDDALASGAAAVLTIDADGQHDVACAPAIIAALDTADLVIGARQRRASSMPLLRRATNAISTATISYAAGLKLPDTQSGYRGIRAEVLRAVHAEGERYEFETDFLIRTARAGFRIASVPIPTIYGAPSHFQNLRDATLVMRAVWRHRHRPRS